MKMMKSPHWQLEAKTLFILLQHHQQENGICGPTLISTPTTPTVEREAHTLYYLLILEHSPLPFFIQSPFTPCCYFHLIYPLFLLLLSLFFRGCDCGYDCHPTLIIATDTNLYAMISMNCTSHLLTQSRCPHVFAPKGRKMKRKRNKIK